VVHLQLSQQTIGTIFYIATSFIVLKTFFFELDHVSQIFVPTLSEEYVLPNIFSHQDFACLYISVRLNVRFYGEQKSPPQAQDAVSPPHGFLEALQEI